MRDQKVLAVRLTDTFSTLPTRILQSCGHGSRIASRFSGGNFVDVADPGETQAIIDRQQFPRPNTCLSINCPWKIPTLIRDEAHDAGRVCRNSDIAQPFDLAGSGEACIETPQDGRDRPSGCSVIRTDAVHPMPNSRAFGPALKSRFAVSAILKTASAFRRLTERVSLRCRTEKSRNPAAWRSSNPVR